MVKEKRRDVFPIALSPTTTHLTLDDIIIIFFRGGGGSFSFLFWFGEVVVFVLGFLFLHVGFPIPEIVVVL